MLVKKIPFYTSEKQFEEWYEDMIKQGKLHTLD